VNPSSPAQTARKRPAALRLWRRRKPPTPPPAVALPSLDRLAGLIERVVELVDEVSGAPAAAPERPTEAQQAVPAATADGNWLAFVSSPHGYTLVDRPGSLPTRGDEVDLDGVRYRVLRHAPSPLPGDGRRCAVVEREEPPGPDRTLDG
jgi:hypothetical protein